MIAISGCQSWSELKTPDEKYEGASLSAILKCRREKGLQKEGESEKAWDKFMPGKTGMGFLDTSDGEEAKRILGMSLDENCKFSEKLMHATSQSDKRKLREILNR